MSPRILIVIAASLMVAGCASVSLDEADGPGRGRSGAAPIVSAPGAIGSPAPEAQGLRADERAATTSGFTAADLQAAGFDAAGGASVYFDFDQTTLRQQDMPVVEQTAGLMKSNSRATLLIEGHTDDRGTSEYNLALGQQRAEAVRNALTLLGVADSQLNAVSQGEERPRSTDRSEAGYAENRRADLQVQ
ncbi:MAG: OmpA family protein [Burkholderiaceae bacterium]|jgi:peptidoglycan-associated lipoprotein|nr:OmpA family protein [Burkholderiaceae bacterium]MDP4801178.1 OmpA family protein [Burkholderiaceae bacterium]